MSLHPQLFYLIPLETEPVARAVFPKGCAIMRIRVLSEFRDRLLAAEKQLAPLDRLLEEILRGPAAPTPPIRHTL